MTYETPKTMHSLFNPKIGALYRGVGQTKSLLTHSLTLETLGVVGEGRKNGALLQLSLPFSWRKVGAHTIILEIFLFCVEDIW